MKLTLSLYLQMLLHYIKPFDKSITFMCHNNFYNAKFSQILSSDKKW